MPAIWYLPSDRSSNGDRRLWGLAGRRLDGSGAWHWVWCYGPAVAIEYRLLGSLEALERGRPLALGAPRQRAVLAWLLLHANEVVLVSRLIDQLWREEPPETAANILQGYVSDLRKVLGRGSIETVGHGYVLRADVSAIDLHRFEALSDEGIEALEDDRPREAAEILRRGLDLWHGPALADLLDEPLAAAAVNRLEELRLTALEKRVDADLASGRHAEVVAELASLVDEYPLRERFRAQLMLALYAWDVEADALASYRAARAILTEESFGIDPGAELQSMEQAILTQDRSLDLVEEVGQRARQVARSRRVVLAVTTGASDPSSLLNLSEALVHKPVFELIVAGLVSDRAELAPQTALLNERARELAHRGVIARAAAFVSAQLGEDIVRLASDRDVVLALLEAPATLLDKGIPDPDLALVLSEAPCDVAFTVARGGSPDGPVVVPFGGVDHDWAAIELGAWVALLAA